jgi:hypothetical protein
LLLKQHREADRKKRRPQSQPDVTQFAGTPPAFAMLLEMYVAVFYPFAGYSMFDVKLIRSIDMPTRSVTQD